MTPLVLALSSLAVADDTRLPPIDEVRSGAVPEATADNAWIQMNSGEWLWGEFKGMRQGRFDIDSDEFGMMTVEVSDVVAAWIVQTQEWLLNDGTTYRGPGVFADGAVRVRDEQAGEVSFPASELAGVAPGGGRERDYWSFYAQVGFNGHWGNSKVLSLAGGLGLKREDARTRLRVDATTSFGTTDEEVTVNNQHGVAQFDVFLTKVFYVVVPKLDIYDDPFQNLSPRFQASSGLGARYKVTVAYEVGGTVAGAYQYTRYESVAAGEPLFEHGAGVALSAYSYWDITGDIDFDVSWTTVLILNDLGQTSHHGQVVWSQEIIEDFNFDVTVTYDRIEDPPDKSDGTDVLSDDLGFVLGLKLDF